VPNIFEDIYILNYQY